MAHSLFHASHACFCIQTPVVIRY